MTDLPARLERRKIDVNGNKINVIGDPCVCVEAYNLKRCPFYGGSAKIKEQSIYGTKSVRVFCHQCKIGTIPYVEGFTHGMNAETRHRLEECLQHAINAWNARQHKT